MERALLVFLEVVGLQVLLISFLGGVDFEDANHYGVFGTLHRIEADDTRLSFHTQTVHLVGQRLQLRQYGVVLLTAVALGRQRVLLIIFTREGSLLQHHVDPELDAVLLAIVQHPTLLAGTVEQREVVLHGTDLEACLASSICYGNTMTTTCSYNWDCLP